MWLHRMDVISQSIMSGHNNMLYKYYRNCSGICMHSLSVFVTPWLQVMQPLTNVQETKWTPYVKRENDVAQSYITNRVLLIISSCGLSQQTYHLFVNERCLYPSHHYGYVTNLHIIIGVLLIISSCGLPQKNITC